MGEYLIKLKELRLKRGVSQKDIAKYLGITAAAYSLYERGSREPNISTLKKIAEYYGVTLDYLIGLDEKTNNNSSTELNQRDLRDIKKSVDNIMGRIENNNGEVLYYDGIEVDLSDETKALLRNALTLAMQAVKLENKEKYNPYKNKRPEYNTLTSQPYVDNAKTTDIDKHTQD